MLFSPTTLLKDLSCVIQDHLGHGNSTAHYKSQTQSYTKKQEWGEIWVTKQIIIEFIFTDQILVSQDFCYNNIIIDYVLTLHVQAEL